MIADVILSIFTLYGAYSFAANAFELMERTSQTTEQKPRIRLKKDIYSPEVEKIINKYIENKAA